MRKTFNVLAVLFTFFMLNAALTISAHAAIGYTVSPILPDNQRGEVSAYFDLNTQPGLTQELFVKVSNDSDEEITVEVEAYTASTNRNGDVVYVPLENLKFTPKHLITDMIQTPQNRIAIPANTTQNIALTLTVPDEPFDGIILGSIRVLKVLSEAEAGASGIVNQYAYSIPIRLHQSDADIEPDFYLDSVEAELVHFSASIVCNVVNPQPKLIRDMTIVAQIYPEGSDTPILEYTNEQVSMAPESFMPLTIKGELDGGFAGGNYVAKMTLQYGGEEWNLEKDFAITVEEATNINERVLVTEENTTALPLWAIVLIIAGVVIVLVVVILAIVLKKHFKKYKEMATKLETIAEQQTGTPGNAEKNAESEDVENE